MKFSNFRNFEIGRCGGHALAWGAGLRRRRQLRGVCRQRVASAVGIGGGRVLPATRGPRLGVGRWWMRGSASGCEEVGATARGGNLEAAGRCLFPFICAFGAVASKIVVRKVLLAYCNLMRRIIKIMSTNTEAKLLILLSPCFLS